MSEKEKVVSDEAVKAAATSTIQSGPTVANEAVEASRFGVVERYPTLNSEAAKFPKPEADQKLSYGTAGFRMLGEKLDSTAFRMGLLAVLRSRFRSAVIGLCFTASHNAACDNGIKIADPDGGVLERSWESYCNELANCDNTKVAECLQRIVDKEKIDLGAEGSIFIARDTRPSGEHLVTLAREAALLLRGNVLDFGILTTPQLHSAVRMYNLGEKSRFTENGYYSMLSEAFRSLMTNTLPNEKDGEVNQQQQQQQQQQRDPTVVVDGANGVGAYKLEKLQLALGTDLVRFDIRNGGNGVLNYKCGADHVYRHRTPPEGVSSTNDRCRRLASFDGDADRIVFHYYDEAGNWHLLDGDAEAVLFSRFLVRECQELGFLQKQKGENGGEDTMTFGCVQTPYANGAATRYMRDVLGLTVACTRTGVKHVHHRAMDFDIGVYFEANGHGTAVFKPSFVEKLRMLYQRDANSSSEEDKLTSRKRLAVTRLLMSYQLINQGVGDALSDLLAMEAILKIEGWGLPEWKALYKNTPSKQIAVKVPDRSKIVTELTPYGLKAKAPSGLQAAIDQLVLDSGDNSRAFVRPSGTEDVVRVYAEADTEEAATKLAEACQAEVEKLLGKVS